MTDRMRPSSEGTKGPSSIGAKEPGVKGFDRTGHWVYLRHQKKRPDNQESDWDNVPVHVSDTMRSVHVTRSESVQVTRNESVLTPKKTWADRIAETLKQTETANIPVEPVKSNEQRPPSIIDQDLSKGPLSKADLAQIIPVRIVPGFPHLKRERILREGSERFDEICGWKTPGLSERPDEVWGWRDLPSPYDPNFWTDPNRSEPQGEARPYLDDDVWSWISYDDQAGFYSDSEFVEPVDQVDESIDMMIEPVLQKIPHQEYLE